MLLCTSFSDLSLIFSHIQSFETCISVNNVDVCVTGTRLCCGTLNSVTSEIPL